MQLGLYWFSRVMGLGSPTRSMASLAQNIWLFPVLGMIFLLLSRFLIQLKSYWLLPRYACHYCTLGLLYHAGYCCDSQALELSKSIDLFPYLGSLYGAFWYYGSQSSVQRILEQIQLYSSESCVNIHDVFSNRNLVSISGRQLRAIVITYVVLGISQTPLTNNSKGGLKKRNRYFSILCCL